MANARNYRIRNRTGSPIHLPGIGRLAGTDVVVPKTLAEHDEVIELALSGAIAIEATPDPATIKAPAAEPTEPEIEVPSELLKGDPAPAAKPKPNDGDESSDSPEA